jgi:hypothetical protein
MTDVTVEQDEGDVVIEFSLKGDSGQRKVNWSQLSDEVKIKLAQLALETITAKANGAVKAIAGVTKLEGKALEDRQAEIRKAADATIKQLEDGVYPGAKKVKVSGAVQTEALRIIKNVVKDQVRSSGQKVGAYTAKEYTAAAKAIFEQQSARYLALAQKALDERAADAKGQTSKSLVDLFGEKANSEEVKAKPKVAPKRKEKGAPLSAKQAGMAAPRQKPGTQHTAH